MWDWTKNTNKASSRNQIAIKEVRDVILILSNHEARMVIETSSVNFELKSEDEQDVLIESFQSFLNALPSSLQILIRVREVDVNQYLERIKILSDKEDQKVYKEQLTNYCSFINQVVSGNKILSRKFYLIIPYQDDSGDFRLVKEQLQLNRDIVLKGLERLGMKGKTLGSLEVLNLFYSFYNHNQIKTQELKGKTIRALLENSYA